MKKTTRLFSLLLSLVVLLSFLTACGPSEINDAGDKGESPKAEIVDGGSRKIVDIFGREVKIPADVKTCAALGSAARLIVYAGGVDKIVACTSMEVKGDPGMPFAYAHKEHFATCKEVATGGSKNTDNAEALIELNPDVIFYQDSNTEALEKLAQKTSIPVIGVYGESFTSDKLTESVALIGNVLGTEEHAEKVVKAIKGWVKELDDLTKDIPDSEKPTVYPGAVSWSGGHGFGGTYINYAPFMAINALNLSDKLPGSGGVMVDFEQIMEWDPDIIFLNPGNMELVNKDYAENPAMIDSLTAVKEGKVYAQVNFNYYWCNMELAIADAYYAGTIIYPEAFKDIDFEKKADEIFTTMVGMPYLKVLSDNNIGFGHIKIGK